MVCMYIVCKMTENVMCITLDIHIAILFTKFRVFIPTKGRTLYASVQNSVTLQSTRGQSSFLNLLKYICVV